MQNTGVQEHRPARMTGLGRCTVAVFRESVPESLNRTESFPIQVDADAIVTAQRFSWDWECLRLKNVWQASR